MWFHRVPDAIMKVANTIIIEVAYSVFVYHLHHLHAVEVL